MTDQPDHGVLITWEGVRTGRERKSMEVWADALNFYEKAQANGQIARQEILLTDQASPLGITGAIQFSGSQTQIETFVESAEFRERLVRASLVVDRLAVTRYVSGPEAAGRASDYFGQVETLGV